MIIKTVDISVINEAHYNPRKDLKPSDPEYKKLKKSIEEFGLVDPLIWNERTCNLVGGHQRFKILKEKKIKNVEVSVVNLSLEKEKLLNIALNKISGVWDEFKLHEIFKELQNVENVDVSVSGFDNGELKELDLNFSIDENIKLPDLSEKTMKKCPACGHEF